MKKLKKLERAVQERIETCERICALCLLQSGKDTVRERIAAYERVLEDIDDIRRGLW